MSRATSSLPAGEPQARRGSARADRLTRIAFRVCAFMAPPGATAVPVTTGARDPVDSPEEPRSRPCVCPPATPDLDKGDRFDRGSRLEGEGGRGSPPDSVPREAPECEVAVPRLSLASAPVPAENHGMNPRLARACAATAVALAPVACGTSSSPASSASADGGPGSGTNATPDAGSVADAGSPPSPRTEAGSKRPTRAAPSRTQATARARPSASPRLPSRSTPRSAAAPRTSSSSTQDRSVSTCRRACSERRPPCPPRHAASPT